LNADFDLIVVGSGFGGSLLAMIARRLGKSVLLLEKGRHPRVVIGESTTPISNLILEDLADRYDLPRLRPLTKWGTWQREYPGIACGLKRGFTFYHHDLDTPRPPDPERGDQLLVEASPHDGIADTHWYRADVDHFFVQEAQRMGVEYLDEVSLGHAAFSDDSATVEGVRQGHEHTWRARFLVDATGPRGFLHRALNLAESSLPGLPETSALYSHFSGVGRLATGEETPYPVDAAAVHHVFDGGWIWVLQFNNGITSAGVATTPSLSARLRLPEGAEAWERLLDRIPPLRRQFAGAEAVRPFNHIPRMPFRSASMVGSGWALLPSAGGFVDPLLSTGFPLTLFGIARLAGIMEHDWDAPALLAYASDTDRDLLVAGRLIASLYANMNNFPLFIALSMLYFAAVSFSETARRLGKAELAGSFLMRDREPFGSASTRIFEQALQEPKPSSLDAELAAIIEPVNIAGLGNTARRNWYPVDSADLYGAAAKLGVAAGDMSALLQRYGFFNR
jgi:tetracycline 7-halogenase / FADH2 O2-dependent halogenase